jgi:large subunit ribosomal protein L21
MANLCIEEQGMMEKRTPATENVGGEKYDYVIRNEIQEQIFKTCSKTTTWRLAGGLVVVSATDAGLTYILTASAVPSVCRARAVQNAAHSASSALELIRSQPTHYVIASVAGRKYLLAPRDVLTVPRLNDVRVGDVLALSEIHELGSREYTLQGNPVIPPDNIRVHATVLEHTKGKMEVVFKKKRRKGYQKTINSKHPYTRLRIGPIEIPVKSSEEQPAGVL